VVREELGNCTRENVMLIVPYAKQKEFYYCQFVLMLEQTLYPRRSSWSMSLAVPFVSWTMFVRASQASKWFQSCAATGSYI
jgi:hypothetical protein